MALTPRCAMLAEQMRDEGDEGEPGTRRDIFQHRFAADPHAVRGALCAAMARFKQEIRAEEAGALELVLAEIMNNIVKHSYAGGGDGTISLSILRDQRGISCSVSDDGVPLPPACLVVPGLPKTAVAKADLPEGGFGWYLIHTLTRDLGYRREAGQNLLAFRLPLGTPDEA
ncbi:ATP-binding protein [Phaeovulum sp.]|uniref:ATP-binding protein n=1 Tax=Phaeovulum sp. TaxID=2934796 RepID=UPI00272F62D0|nr:ATP-binding protein [Phaeovulum sp.]MDP1668925.1 ATP-binding protein [Phaeovulum sp.]MDZ4119196.1 ATP-binding protein [Phaeovulum sp.]